jgi:hypothetical protein
MTGTIISGAYTTGFSFTAASADPILVVVGANVANTAGDSFLLGGTPLWTITNDGTLSALTGIEFGAGGTAINNGLIQPASYGAGIAFDKNNVAGFVTNTGTIAGGPSQIGIEAYYAVNVSNASAGLITGFDGMYAGGNFYGGGAATVTNAGTILGSATSTGQRHSNGIRAGAGLTLVNEANAVIGDTGSAYSEAGIDAASGATIDNAGTIFANRDVSTSPREQYHTSYGIQLAGGSLTNASTGNIYAKASGNYTHVHAVVGSGFITIDNAGTIGGTESGYMIAVDLYGGGIVTNEPTGTIAGKGFNLDVIQAIRGGTFSMVNEGHITGIGAYAIRVGVPSYITNAPSGTIAAQTGIFENGSTEMHIVNQGLISDNHSGVEVTGVYPNYNANNPSTIVNMAGGTIISGGQLGYEFVVNGAEATIVNAGSIIGSTYPGNGGRNGAIYMRNAFASRIVVDPGAVFVGNVNGGNVTANTGGTTLELAPGTMAGTLAGFGSQFHGIYNVTFDAGAQWTLGINPAAASAVLAGFVVGDTLDLAGYVETTSSFSAGQLTLGGATTLTLNLPGAYTTSQFHLTSDGNGGTDITVACFAEGTHILTETGPVAVEHLALGTRLPTASGRLASIVWLGNRSLEPARHKRPHDVNPIRVRADTFGPGLPTRDLILSPDHAVLIDGLLVPIRHLANGTSIAQEPRSRVTYWHIELDRHDVLLAEGLACETYLDTGNRDAFEGKTTTHLHPDFAQRHAEHLWAQHGCADILTDTAAPALRRLHTRLLVSAAQNNAARAA